MNAILCINIKHASFTKIESITRLIMYIHTYILTIRKHFLHLIFQLPVYLVKVSKDKCPTANFYTRFKLRVEGLCGVRLRARFCVRVG